MTPHGNTTQPVTALDSDVTLRSPGDLADALPYLLGYHPEDCIVIAGLYGARGRVIGRIRAALPADPAEWPLQADALAAALVSGGPVGPEPLTGAVVYLCPNADDPGTAREGMERLRPLAQLLRTACGAREIPVCEALFIADRRFWSYLCVRGGCCDADGTPLPEAGSTELAAASAVSGIRVQGTQRELEGRLRPLRGPAAARQIRELDAAARTLMPRLLGPEAAAVRRETLELARRLVSRLRRAPGPALVPAQRTAGGDHEQRREKDRPARPDDRDDALITSDEAARMILGLQDLTLRDTLAEWMEGPDAAPALRLWRALARRCVAAYEGHAAPPLTLAGWVSWCAGDTVGARIALMKALEADPEYLFAALLHQAMNEGMDPEPLRRCMRGQRSVPRL
ncbi:MULTISPECIES: DUF4192 domain-containing protein [unclassified Streptomyces]|uniref:DUF4192 domain-containing protein n=1 Tax=unclassified Streptomyces TaxID=2593676 RepID=UPI0019044C76|nr:MULTISPECIES: DUF4192 domain-containing protein [unclassified Streptomyces]MCU4746576.1 DUF4192 domain-containing protein [Streptomyces sp. G-5]QQN76837.1 DUF4192 domain-containing protein [Streptomyces sp. XC 2026]